MPKLNIIYNYLLKSYGPQGWWPLSDVTGCNPTKTGAMQGYHPKDYSYPANERQIFEICIGAILAQNTNWQNVETAILNLKKVRGLSLKGIKILGDGKIRECIRPAGYHNQKSKYLKEFIKFYEGLNGKVPSREEILSVKGIGPETADSMLLYAFKVPTFVVDTYTRRILTNLKMITMRDSYDTVKSLFEKEIKLDVAVYQEFHALLVEHAKRFYSKKGEYSACPLLKLI